ncbi:P-type conjugative transfer protein VirB9 [Phenylobacterium sp. LjRoot219]|uniref:P-type conjugative transfer protein VirB9 n=1 Tax=Phenylobacterium sp. LjRoot219 TaxID=3342283 RepID=UPI003ED0A766
MLAASLAVSLMLTGAGAAVAVEAPKAGQADPRMRWIDYNPSQVYRVQGAFRTATQILFGPDETILHVALGDSVSWEVAAEKNILFIKPKERQAATNLIVTTTSGDQLRNYMFELVTAASSRRGGAYYQIRFRYPQDERDRATSALTAAQAAVQQRIAALKLEHGVVVGARNFNYTVQGASELQPSEVSDNGRFTVLRFPANQAMPTIFAVTADGTERLVPFDVRGEFVVIHSVERTLRLRRGRRVLCIYNDAHQPYGVNLGTGTSSPEIDRTLKGAPW